MAPTPANTLVSVSDRDLERIATAARKAGDRPLAALAAHEAAVRAVFA